jgi:error-prone DNA polymerase
MPPWHDSRNRSNALELREAAYDGARQRYGEDLPEPVVDRLEHELRIIGEMNFCAYFLLVQDIVRRSPRTCGRGSGAASLVAYCLGITNVCPVKHNLYFGRFLNPGRTDPPDIDVDFAWDERDDLIGGVLDQYGDHAAMVSSHILFQPRMAVRETAKVFGLTDAEIGRVTRRLPWFWRIHRPGASLISDLQQRPEAKALDFIHPWPEILSLAEQLIGIPRYLSVHPGGVVITPQPVSHYVPVQRAAKGVPIIQWEKEATEDAGLVKIDLLGNRSLGVIRDAIHNVRENRIDFKEYGWEPEDDADTQALLAQGRTMGCFYIESPAMRLLQQKAGVGDFEHLVIHSSIIRPAANDCIQEYIRRLHGGSLGAHPPPAHRCARRDLRHHGLPGGCLQGRQGPGRFRCRSRRPAQDHVQKRPAAAPRRLPPALSRRSPAARCHPEQIEAIWQMMMSFSGYSFCKPHSASYARVSFQAAYLKVHHPAEFMAAVISNQGGFYSTFAYVSEARRLGVEILPPDVRHSHIHWTGRDNAMRVGLMAIRGLSAKTLDRIVTQRSRRPFDHLFDFFERIRPSR